MFNKPMQPFQNVAAGAIATLRVMPEQLTLMGVMFALGGTTFDTSHISFVRLKVGARTVIDVTGAELLRINAYKGEAITSNKILLLDFAEQDQTLPVREIGGYDLMALLELGEITIEVGIAAGAVAPTLEGFGFYTPSQRNPLIKKYIRYVFPATVAGDNALAINLRGAQLQRLYLTYTGTDWTASANGNLSRVEVKRDGVVIHDLQCLRLRSLQGRMRPARVPQSRTYIYDPIIDDNPAGMIRTVNTVRNGSGVIEIPASLEFKAVCTAADVITAVAEVLDAPANL